MEDCRIKLLNDFMRHHVEKEVTIRKACMTDHITALNPKLTNTIPFVADTPIECHKVNGKGILTSSIIHGGAVFNSTLASVVVRDPQVLDLVTVL
jgi:hypothetical protein